MKNFFTLFVLAAFSLVAYAQPNQTMRFAGPSTFGVAAMNAWQENETDTIVFQMLSTSEADITLPVMNYKAMGVTIPSFTIHGLTFDFDMSTRNATFADQTYSETLTVDGVEKVVTGSAFVADYNSVEQTFTLETSLSYGKMPVVVTFKINAKYVKPETTSLSAVTATGTDTIYDLVGRKVNTLVPGRIYIKNGRKVIAR